MQSEVSITRFSVRKQQVISFVWQHTLLIVSLAVMTLGVALSVRSDLGSSVISTIPFVLSLAGADGLAPECTIGEYTYMMNAVLVAGQIIILRRRFEPVQLFQLVIGFFFGYLLDVNMWLTSGLSQLADSLAMQGCLQLAGCIILAMGISLEIRCGSVTMPGEGFPVALSRVAKMPFARAKIMTDITLVVIAVVAGFIFFGTWPWRVVGPGTLFAMLFVGYCVKLFNPYMGWFDRCLAYRPGFRRYLYGLARYIYKK